MTDVAPKAHIALLEEAAANAVTVPFSALSTTAGSASLKEALRVHGFAVVTGVVEPEEIAHAEALWGSDLRSIASREHSTNTELLATIAADPVRQWPAALPLGAKFASDFGLPHGQLGWWARRHLHTRRVYEALHDTPDLIVGMDNIFFNPRPLPEGTDLAALTAPLWPHADLNSHRKPEGDWEVIQGILYLWGAAADTSATVVWPGSHLGEFEQLMAERGAACSGHFVMMKPDDFPRFVDGARRVPVPPGAMLLWSSRTIHQGWSNGARLAVPVCFEPRARRTDPASLQRKTQCVVDGIPTSHWASLDKAHACTAAPQPVTTFECGVALEHKAHGHAVVDGSVDASILRLL